MEQDLMQRKLLIGSLINSPGFKLLESELKSYIDSVEQNRKNVGDKPCNDIGGFNYLNGWRRGLKDLEYILDGFREELEAEVTEQIAVER